jgi:hypothetical protein
MRPELEKTQIMLPEPINFVRDDVITKKCQRRLFAFVPVDAALEFGAVSGPGSERVVAFFILRQTSDRLEPDPLRLAFARGSAVVRNPRIQMPDQFIRGHLDPKSIDHTTPLVEARCKRIAIRECACFGGRPSPASGIWCTPGTLDTPGNRSTAVAHNRNRQQEPEVDWRYGKQNFSREQDR